MAFDVKAPTVQHLMGSSIWDGNFFVNSWKTSESGACEVTDKATGEVLAKVALASPADVRASSLLIR